VVQMASVQQEGTMAFDSLLSLKSHVACSSDLSCWVFCIDNTSEIVWQIHANDDNLTHILEADRSVGDEVRFRTRDFCKSKVICSHAQSVAIQWTGNQDRSPVLYR
jgi:hypothetical protein